MPRDDNVLSLPASLDPSNVLAGVQPAWSGSSGDLLNWLAQTRMRSITEGMTDPRPNILSRFFSSQPRLGLASDWEGNPLPNALIARSSPQPFPYANRPIGTESVNEVALTEPHGTFDPIVDPNIARWPGRPMTQSEYNAVQDASIDLFNQAVALTGVGETAPPGAGRVMLASRRAGRLPPPPMPPAPPPVPQLEPPGGYLAATPEEVAAINVNRGQLLSPNLPEAPPEGERGMAAVPSFRTMTPDAAVEAARGEPHIIEKPGGGFVGAPSHILTREDLDALRARFDAKADAGISGADWYQRSIDWIKSVSGGDPILERQLAEQLAVTSPQTPPLSNMQFMLTGRNAVARGQPVDIIRNTATAKKFNETAAAQAEALSKGETLPDMPQGEKTGPFELNIDPTAPSSVTSVNDIWHGRAWEFTMPDGSLFDGTPTSAQHKWMDGETLLAADRANERAAGGRTDWTSSNVQAAPWVAGKAAKLRADFPKLSDAEVWARANEAFGDRAADLTASVPMEQKPGSITGLDYGSMSPEEFSARSTWVEPGTGQDALLRRGLGYLTPVTQDAPGVYINALGQAEYNPAQVARVLTDFAPTPDTKPVPPRTIHPGTVAALDAAQAVRGLIDVQEGSPWNFVHVGETGPTANALRISIGRQPTPGEAAALSKIAADNGFIYAAHENGAAFLPDPFREGGAHPGKVVNKMLTGGGLAQDVGNIVPGARVQRGSSLGNYISYGPENEGELGPLDIRQAGQGNATRRMFDYLNAAREQAPDVYNRILDSKEVQTKAAANLQRLADSGQLGKRPDYEELLRIVSAGRLRGLMEHTQRVGFGGLPAVGAAVGLGAGIAGASGSRRRDE